MGVRIWTTLMKLGARCCHQRPDRSFFFRGYQFPVCARCTGLAIGYVVMLIMWYHWELAWQQDLLLAIPLILDGGTQYLRMRESTQRKRLLTGILCGVGVMDMEIKLLQMILEWGKSYL